MDPISRLMLWVIGAGFAIFVLVGTTGILLLGWDRWATAFKAHANTDPYAGIGVEDPLVTAPDGKQYRRSALDAEALRRGLVKP